MRMKSTGIPKIVPGMVCPRCEKMMITKQPAAAENYDLYVCLAMRTRKQKCHWTEFRKKEAL